MNELIKLSLIHYDMIHDAQKVVYKDLVIEHNHVKYKTKYIIEKLTKILVRFGLHVWIDYKNKLKILFKFGLLSLVYNLVF
jgi:hypothetical protein